MAFKPFAHAAQVMPFMAKANSRPLQASYAAQGSPSTRQAELMLRSGGGVVVRTVRNLKDAQYLEPDDMAKAQAIAESIADEAVRLSQGPLKQPVLNKMGNPYGYGRHNPRGMRRRGLGRLGRRVGFRQGVSNMAVVNRQSGTLARSWQGAAQLTPQGIVFSTVNTAEHSRFVGFGTVKMRGHGPWLIAHTRALPRINNETARLARIAYLRRMAEMAMGVR